MMSSSKERATKLEWLEFFYEYANFGPAHEDVMIMYMDDFKRELQEKEASYPMTTAVAPLFRTQNLSPAIPFMKASPDVAP